MHKQVNETRIRLHLVHGTWAKGLMGITRSWSEKGEAAYEYLRLRLPVNSQFESFTWSGRNSIAARSNAANDFKQHLRQSLLNHPTDCHIVVAHSHGGTVANQAVSSCDLDGAIRGLICLATPFVYLVSPSFGRFQTCILAMTAVAYSLYLTALLAWMPWIPEFLGFFAFSGLVAIKSILALYLMSIIAKKQSTTNITNSQKFGPKKTSVFLLRGMQDEASLLLAGAQFFDAICAAFAKYHEGTELSIRRPFTLLGYPLIYGSCCVIGSQIAIVGVPTFMPNLDESALTIVGAFVYGPAIAGLIYLLGFSVVAVSAGHLSVLQWLSSVVEVEVSPPNTPSQMYVFSSVGTKGFRHSLYNDRVVLDRVAVLAKSIAQS